ncbi:MAG: non-hydrolyzing UDP-N-acetylglucosamine 2-epimerase [Gammaproteobacteria bacterium]
MKIFTIVGARPQFIKAATVSRVIRRDYDGKIKEVLIHTGQHYDDNMSRTFFEELDIPEPEFNLDINRGNHGEMTGRMLTGIEALLLQEKPDWVLVYGDTNSTLAGALAAVKLHLPVVHVEAGLRSFNMKMPEEVNRVLTDRVSSMLFCPTETAVRNLAEEGVRKGVYNVGDVMYDASRFYRQRARERSRILERLNVAAGQYALATCHRAENTDVPARLSEILKGLGHVAGTFKVVFPMHPRTRKLIESAGLRHLLGNVVVVEPLSYLDMIRLEEEARVIITDSGGVQKEACFYGVPCVTLRDETEWVETVESGWNHLVGANAEQLESEALRATPTREPLRAYGEGHAAEVILQALSKVA